MEGTVSYWIVANSWGLDFGMQGIFYILQGSDNSGIETAVAAAQFL